MCDHGLGHKGAAAIAGALRPTGPIRRLVLRGNGMGHRGAAALFHALEHCPKIEALDLGFNDLRSGALDAAAELIGSAGMHLKELYLDGNTFFCMDVPDFCESLHDDRRLEKLSVAHNRIGDVGAGHFARMLSENSQLEYFDTRYNIIRRAGAAALGQALEANSTLTRIMLGNNGACNGGAEAFAAALSSNSTLEALGLPSNNISDPGALAIAEMLTANRTLLELDLSYNPISPAGLKALLLAIEGNTALTHVGLDGIPFDKECRELLRQILAGRPELAVEADGAVDPLDTDALRRRALELTRQVEDMRSRRLSEMRALVPGGDGMSEAELAAWLAAQEAEAERMRERANRKMQRNAGAARRGSDGDGGGSDSSEVSDDSSDPDSDDEFAVMQSRWRRDARARRRFSKAYPDMEDPMAILEEYVDEKRLRLVDLFFAIDKDRSGGISFSEVIHAVAVRGAPRSAAAGALPLTPFPRRPSAWT